MRYVIAICVALACGGCGGSSSSRAAAAKVTQFYSPDKKIPRGVKGSLCYGVENANRVELSPAVETLWPSPVRCFDISPTQNTTYTIAAYGEDGSKDTKTVEVKVGAAPPRLYDLKATSASVHPGQTVHVCFKVENATGLKAAPGRFDKAKNCLTDSPKKTTVYKISALGGDNQVDTGTVTVRVR